MSYLLTTNPEGFKEFDLKSSEDEDIYTMRWIGDSKAKNWQAPELCVLEDEFTSFNDEIADIASFKAGSFVFSKKAFDVLNPLFDGLVEFLPAKYEGDTWYILNVINVLDIVDREKSRHKIYKSGKVGFITHAFLKEVGESKSAIFIAKDFHPYVFINEITRKAIAEAGLTGALIREYRNP